MKKEKVAKKLPKSRQIWVPKIKTARKSSVKVAGERLGSQATSKLLAPSPPPAVVSLPSSASDPTPSAPVPPLKPHCSVDASKSKMKMEDHLGPSHEDRGKAPVNKTLVVPQTGGRTRPPIKSFAAQKCPAASKQTRTPQCTCSCTMHKRTPGIDHLGVRIETQEPVKVPHSQGGGSKRATPDATLDRSKATTDRPENVNKVLHP